VRPHPLNIGLSARLLLVLLLLGLGQVLLAQGQSRPLRVGAAQLQAVTLEGAEITFTEAAPLARALGLRLTVADSYLTLELGTTALALRIQSTALGALYVGNAFTLNGQRQPGAYGAVRDGGRLYLPLRSVAEALGALLSEQNAGFELVLPPASLSGPVQAENRNGYTRAVFPLSREANQQSERQGDEIVLTIFGATGPAASYSVAGGQYFRDIKITPSAAGLEVRIPSNSRAFQSFNLAGRVVLDVGALGSRLEQPSPPLYAQTTPLVVLDPGHGGADLGVSGNGLVEKNLTLAFAREVGASLAARGIRVSYSRSADRNPSLAQRVEASLKADVFVSFHASGLRGASADGLRIFAGGAASDLVMLNQGRATLNASSDDPAKAVLGRFIASGSESLLLANAIAAKIQSFPDLEAKVVPFGNLVPSVLARAPRLSLLIELGWLSSDKDALRLSTQSSRTALVTAIANAISETLAPRLPLPVTPPPVPPPTPPATPPPSGRP
jgi:N-acetylmuramoyl-L-alanine amidase